MLSEHQHLAVKKKNNNNNTAKKNTQASPTHAGWNRTMLKKTPAYHGPHFLLNSQLLTDVQTRPGNSSHFLLNCSAE